MKKNIALIFAGGAGNRMGNVEKPKQFLEVRNKPIIIHTLNYFQNHEKIDDIVIVCIESWIDYLKEILDEYGITKVRKIVPGGNSGQDSIYQGLLAAQSISDNEDDVVLIHDGVRPILTSTVISDVIESVEKHGSGIPCVPCCETIISTRNHLTIGYVPLRNESYIAQAPQGYLLNEILGAHQETRKNNPTYENVIDSCTMYHLLGKTTHMVQGNDGNIKITTPKDVFILEALFDYQDSIEKK